jgi:hypothetical protein
MHAIATRFGGISITGSNGSALAGADGLSGQDRDGGPMSEASENRWPEGSSPASVGLLVGQDRRLVVRRDTGSQRRVVVDVDTRSSYGCRAERPACKAAAVSLATGRTVGDTDGPAGWRRGKVIGSTNPTDALE